MGLNIIVHGACGRMGRMLIAAIARETGPRLVQAIEHAGCPHLGEDAGTIAGVGKMGVPVKTDILPGADVCIDFSLPPAIPKLARALAEHRVPLVLCTTGVTEEGLAAIKSLAETAGGVRTANTSLGVNLLLDLAARAARALGDAFDVEIVDIHHRHKKDAPSGTALALRDAVAAAMDRDGEKTSVYGRHGETGPRKAGEIAVHALRGGDVVGEHTVVFAGDGERVELVHRAQSRETFARGALAAARWLRGKPPGMYAMSDVLGIDH